MSDFETLLYSVDEGIATIALNRSTQLNALNAVMSRELIAAFDRTDSDDEVRAVIVTGEGRAFCAGADLSGGRDSFDGDKFAALAPENVVDGVYRDSGGRITLRIFDSLKPVIAAVNGPAVGFGASLNLAMDFRLASEEARFGFVFARRGIVMESCSSWFLPRVVGMQTALEWGYSGRVFSAQEAHERGLVRSVHAPDDLLPAARALAHEVTANSAPVSVALMRQMLWRMVSADHPMEAHRIESRVLMELGRSADPREGVQSFLEKRPARFPGKISTDMPAAFPWWRDPKF
ncbi:enoyl-CoA hydratase/carnithine racemase [Paraburkholderia sp. GAS448]|jgi:enoyl-CoA hydratase/carnithine racemase|uniref:crotonase/enoyl-CoA hydratase family protein n=1 Tax=Paraburkholderia sp. GAS448 TaxID=3035136 RepID=UPI003D22E1D7